MKVLFIGGTGEISTACVSEALACGHEVTVLNRGESQASLPAGVEHVRGDLREPDAYDALAAREFDVVCQFLAFTPETVERDIEFFSGRCGQYLFMSTTSAYQKRSAACRISETTPLENPFWAYSRAKAACERVVQEAAITSTIVRPSHTYRTRLPSTVIDGNHLAWRMTNNKPVIVHDDGASLWTLTHANDFARAFMQLAGNAAAFDEVFHITSDDAWSWKDILAMAGTALGLTPDIRCVASKELIAHLPALEGPLLGDKANSMAFDNSKIRAVAGDWRCRVEIAEGIGRAAEFVRERLAAGYRPDQQQDALIDRIVAEHGP